MLVGSLCHATYVDRPVALLHVVGSEKVGDASKLVKEVVLETEHRGRTDDGGLGVDRADDLLTPGLYMPRQYPCVFF